MDLWWTGIALAMLVLVLVLSLALRQRSRPSGGARNASALDALDTVVAWEPQATRLMTSTERLAYITLLRALPDHMILAQVPLSRFLRVPTRYSYAEWMARVGQLCADFVVCDTSSKVMAVVEVRPAAQSDRGRKRFERMGRVLQAAGVQLHVWSEQSLPSVTAVREMLLPGEKHALPIAPLAAIDAAFAEEAEAGLANGAARAFEMHDPPPSTWFDDLEVQPAPTKSPPSR